MGNGVGLMQPPQKILVATDLGSTSDRALDRAVQLAQHWQAKLHVVHAMRPEAAESWWPSTHDYLSLYPDNSEVMKRQIRRDLGEEADDAVIHVNAGEPHQVIQQTAARENCELIIMGAGHQTFSDTIVDNTTAQLLHHSSQSVLIVKSRPYGIYNRILIGTDFTDESRLGLKTATSWFPAANFGLMHVLDIPYRSLLLDAGRKDELIRLEHDTMASFIEGARLPEGIRQRIRTHIEYGYPEIILNQHALATDVNLTVVGAVKRGLAFRVLIGSNAARIMQTVPNDLLMVRAAQVALAVPDGNDH